MYMILAESWIGTILLLLSDCYCKFAGETQSKQSCENVILCNMITDNEKDLFIIEDENKVMN